MKNIKTVLLALLLVVVATSCTFVAQSKERVEKNFSIKSFTSVRSHIVGNVIYTQSDDVSVYAEGEKKLMDLLTIIEEDDGTLNIFLDAKIKNLSKKDLTVYISSPTIEKAILSGVGNFKMEGSVDADDLVIDFEGVGNFEAMYLRANSVDATYEGVGNLKLGGTTNDLKIDSDGVGLVDAEKLRAKNAVVRSNGVGGVRVYASESIDIYNNGVGNVSYYGDPEVKELKNAGVGKIRGK